MSAFKPKFGPAYGVGIGVGAGVAVGGTGVAVAGTAVGLGVAVGSGLASAVGSGTGSLVGVGTGLAVAVGTAVGAGADVAGADVAGADVAGAGAGAGSPPPQAIMPNRVKLRVIVRSFLDNDIFCLLFCCKATEVQLMPTQYHYCVILFKPMFKVVLIFIGLNRNIGDYYILFLNPIQVLFSKNRHILIWGLLEGPNFQVVYRLRLQM